METRKIGFLTGTRTNGKVRFVPVIHEIPVKPPDTKNSGRENNYDGRDFVRQTIQKDQLN